MKYVTIYHASIVPRHISRNLRNIIKSKTFTLYINTFKTNSHALIDHLSKSRTYLTLCEIWLTIFFLMV